MLGARCGFPYSSAKEVQMWHVCVHACKLLETRDMGTFNGFGSVTHCPEKRLGGKLYDFSSCSARSC